MTLSVGEKIPQADVMTFNADGPQKSTSTDLLGSGKVVLFSVPGAFTPTCSAKHLPGFVEQADAIRAKGVDKIVCMSVNDAFVMKAWAEASNVGSSIEMLADGNGDFTRAIDLSMDGSGFGLGQRSQRFACIIENGVVTALNVEAPGAFDVSSAEYVLGQL